ncbi:hypothetical protein ACSBR2_034303 [Camellia fascicularis]
MRLITNFTLMITFQATKTYAAVQSNHITGQLPHHTTNWALLFAGTIKLNIDGCSKSYPETADYESLFRDERGTWVHGYHGRLEEGLEAELGRAYRGLTIMLEKGMKDITIETGFVQVIKLIQEDSSPTFQHKTLLEDAKFLMQRSKCNHSTHPRRRKQSC